MHFNFNYIKAFSIILFTFAMQGVYSQTKNSELLNEANRAYTEGKYEKVVELLESKIDDNQLDKLGLEQATKLLSSSYYKLDENEAAEALVLTLLKNNPTYQVQSSIDPQPFVQLIDKYDRSPRTKVGFKVGRFQPFIKSLTTNQVWDTDNYSQEYTTQGSASFSIYLDYLLNKNLSLSLGSTMSQIKFQEEVDYGNMVNLTYSESSSYFKIPFNIKYNIYSKNNFKASISAGLYASVIGQTQSSLVYQIPTSGEFDASDYENLQRNKYNSGYQLGMNLEYTKNKFCYNASVNYGSDFSLYNAPDANYTNNSLLTDYNYSSGDIKMSQLNLQVGVAYVFSYKIKRKYRSK